MKKESHTPRTNSIEFFRGRLDSCEPWEGAGQSLRQFLCTRVALKLSSMESDTSFVARLVVEKLELERFQHNKPCFPTTMHVIRGGDDDSKASILKSFCSGKGETWPTDGSLGSDSTASVLTQVCGKQS